MLLVEICFRPNECALFSSMAELVKRPNFSILLANVTLIGLITVRTIFGLHIENSVQFIYLLNDQFSHPKLKFQCFLKRPYDHCLSKSKSYKFSA